MQPICRDNRELSWLKFNVRVLEEAEDASNPFCERLSFASIYQSNLDEFFGVRVGSLHDQMLLSGDMRDANTEMTCQEQIDAIFAEVRSLTKRMDACWQTLNQELARHGIEVMKFHSLEHEDVKFLDHYFQQEVRPLLAPQVVGKKQPFPFLKDKAIYAVVVLGPKKAEKSDKLGIVPCSIDVLPRLVRIPEHPNRYILMEDLIYHYLKKIFSHFEVKSRTLIRIIRNADIDPDEETYGDDADFRQVMEQLVSMRRRLAPVKLEYTARKDESVIDMLCRYLSLDAGGAVSSEAPLDFSFFSVLCDRLRGFKTLFYERYTPRWPAGLDRERSMLRQVEEKDRLLFFPYESMDAFLRLLNDAAVDPDVVSVKITLYRVAQQSKVIDALIRAAENGKEVRVLLELRARFDEENNIEWSRRLEEAGCSILYGLDDLKVHAKLCLITLKEGDGIRYITQIGTGNYNEKTAGLYTDLSLMTASDQIGREVADIFTHLYLDEVVDEAGCLMVAPRCLRTRIFDLIDAQIARAKAGKSAYIGAKMNSLTDRTIIDRLILASCAGVQIDLIVRGACCLIAGVPDATEHISVRSIVGRFLEHSRIFIFGSAQEEADGAAQEIFLSSADLMTRNTTRRVEVAVPIYDPDIRARVLDMFRILMADNVKARVQLPDGNYVRAPRGDEPLDAQEFFLTPYVPQETE